MADNATITAVSPNPLPVRTTDDGTHHHQHIVMETLEGSTPTAVSSAAPLPVQAEMKDSAAIDAFGRLRVANPAALFDSKLLHDKQPLLWDEVLTGTGSSAHSSTNSAVTMTVAASGDKVERQTFMRFNYQPGRSQLLMMTFNMGGATANVRKRIGYFDTNNGLFLEQTAAGDLTFVVRKAASDTAVSKASWNIDAFDGTGPSGVTLDITDAQILVIDFEWLGVGRVRFGFVVDGKIYYAHEVLNANAVTTVYMSTPNLPLRYEIEATGVGADSMDHICSVVIAEGGARDNGVSHYISTNGTHVDANVADTIYALLGYRLRSTFYDAVVKAINASVLAETADPFEWMLCVNPTLSGSPSFTAETNSPIEVARPSAGETVSATGFVIAGGFVTNSSDVNVELDTILHPGVDIAGTGFDEFWLCVRPLGANADIQGSMTLREYV